MRSPRIKPSDQPAVFHCISRTVGGRHLLDIAERMHFRGLLWKVTDFCGIDIITYTVLSNHFHLLLRTPGPQDLQDQELVRRVCLLYGKEESLRKAVTQDMETTGKISGTLRKRLLRRMGDVSACMKELKQRFTRGYNRRKNTFGTIWAERFKSLLVEDEPSAVRAVAAYIDLNSIRAGLVQDPGEYEFCGYAEALGGNQTLRQNLGRYLAGQEWEEHLAEYRQYLFYKSAEPGNAEKKGLSSEEILERLKQGPVELNQLLRVRVRYMTDGKVLGSKGFVEEMFQLFRVHFGQRRRTGAREMEGADWGELKVLGALRRKLFG